MAEHLGIKKLHLNKKGNSLLANNFLKYLRSTFWDDIDSNCFEVNVHECESKLDIPDRLSDVVSERSLKVIRTKNPNWIVLAHLNLNSYRPNFRKCWCYGHLRNKTRWFLSWKSIQNSWVFLTIPFRSRSEPSRYHGICPWEHYSQIFIFRG